MSPPISKDWWLAAALTGATLPNAMAQTPPAAGPDAGLITSYEAGKPVATQPLYVTAASGQRVVTGPAQTAHVLFPDQSALTLGPNSEIVISRYEFDSRSKSGNMAVSMTKGLLRVVGGLISKNNPIRVSTPTATVGIRGGISALSFQPPPGGGESSFQGAFLFGNQMQFFGPNGALLGNDLTRPGSGFLFGAAGFQLFSPLLMPPFLQSLRGFFEIGPFGQGLVGPFGSGGGIGGGTLPFGTDPNLLSSDRLPTGNDVGSPNQGGTGGQPGLTLPEVLGGTPGPGNQS